MDTSTAPPPRVSRRVLTIPNALSALRLASVPVFIWLFAADYPDTAFVLYAVGAGTDFFDGYIARRTGSVTELGQLLDPLADRIFIVALAAVLVARDALPVWLAGAIIGRDLLLVVAFPLLERRGVERIRVRFIGKLATACLLFGLSSLALAETSFVGAGVGDEVGIAFTLAGAVVYWAATVAYAHEARDKLRSVGS